MIVPETLVGFEDGAHSGACACIIDLISIRPNFSITVLTIFFLSRPFCQMSRERKRLAAEGFNLGCRCFQILCLAAGDNHFGSCLGESKRDSPDRCRGRRR